MPVSVIDSNGCIFIDDGNSQIYPKKEKVTVGAVGNNVVIRWDRVHYSSYIYTDFTAPTGASAVAVAALISAMLNTDNSE